MYGQEKINLLKKIDQAGLGIEELNEMVLFFKDNLGTGV
ncbi:MAG: hypothetical protein ACJAZX_000649 [Rickettsiales bacterium]